MTNNVCVIPRSERARKLRIGFIFIEKKHEGLKTSKGAPLYIVSRFLEFNSVEIRKVQ